MSFPPRCAKNRRRTPARVPLSLAGLLSAVLAMAQPPPPYHYQGEVRIEPDTGRLVADWTITVREPEPRERTFLLRDTLPKVRVAGDVVESRMGRREGLDGFTAVTVVLDPDSERPVLRLAYEGVPIPEPMDNDINGIEPERIELNVDSFWFPIDARFTQKLTADLRLAVPGEGWQAVSTGATTPTDDGFRIVNDDPHLDIAFTASRRFRITEAEGFTVYDQRAQSQGTDTLVETAGYCRDFLNARWGRQKPLPASRLLIARRDSSGYARENYIVFTDVADPEPAKLTRFVCHEFAHQWAAGAPFNTVDNWINEGFAEYLGMMAVRERLGQDAFDELLAAMREQVAGERLPPLWTPGATERRPYLVNYRVAPLALFRLEQAIGAEPFLAFTQALLAQPVKTTPALLNTLEAVAGTQARETFAGLLAEGAGRSP